MGEAVQAGSVVHDCAPHVLMEVHHLAAQLGRTTNLFPQMKEVFSTDQIKNLGQVDECQIQWLALLSALLLKPDHSEY